MSEEQNKKNLKKPKKNPLKNRKFTSILTTLFISLFYLTPTVVAKQNGLGIVASLKLTELITGRKFGPDRRRKATTHEQLTSPVVRILVIDQNDKANFCTAAAIAKYVYLTAAHCLDRKVQQIMLDRGDYLPGKNTIFATTDQYAIYNKYDGSEKNDIALVFTGDLDSHYTDDQPANSWFKVDVFPTKNAETLELQTQGFPSDKKGEMWKATYKGFQTGRFGDYLSSPGVSFGGQSGSPFFAPETGTQDEHVKGTIYGVLSGTRYLKVNPKEKMTTIAGLGPEHIRWIRELQERHENNVRKRDLELAK